MPILRVLLNLYQSAVAGVKLVDLVKGQGSRTIAGQIKYPDAGQGAETVVGVVAGGAVGDGQVTGMSPEVGLPATAQVPFGGAEFKAFDESNLLGIDIDSDRNRGSEIIVDIEF